MDGDSTGRHGTRASVRVWEGRLGQAQLYIYRIKDMVFYDYSHYYHKDIYTRVRARERERDCVCVWYSLSSLPGRARAPSWKDTSIIYELFPRLKRKVGPSLWTNAAQSRSAGWLLQWGGIIRQAPVLGIQRRCHLAGKYCQETVDLLQHFRWHLWTHDIFEPSSPRPFDRTLFMWAIGYTDARQQCLWLLR